MRQNRTTHKFPPISKNWLHKKAHGNTQAIGEEVKGEETDIKPVYRCIFSDFIFNIYFYIFVFLTIFISKAFLSKEA